jgi:RIP metalloprotease RseP
MPEFLSPLAYLYVIPVLGFMILIHEFGHYAVAKLLGVRVEQFAIGFGKRLFGFRKGETDYRVNLLPLGGYVKMSGENPMDERTDDPGEFMNHPRWHRFLIAIAGPTMNVLLAIFLLTTVYMVHYEYPVYMDKPAVIDGVRSNSPAAQVGIQAGDRVVKIDGITNPTWEQLAPRVFISPNQPIAITIQRGDQLLEKTIVPKPITTSEVGSAGWYPAEPVIIGRLEKDMPAIKAGLKENDKVVGMNGKPLVSIDEMIERLQDTKDQPVELAVIRGNQNLTFRMQAVLSNKQKVFTAASGAGEKNRATQDFAEGRLRSHRNRTGNRLPSAAKGLDSADGPDRRHQPEPGHFQPAADSHSRWRRDHVPVDRRPYAPRHQPAHQGTHLPDGVCVPGAVCPDGDL